MLSAPRPCRPRTGSAMTFFVAAGFAMGRAAAGTAFGLASWIGPGNASASGRRSTSKLPSPNTGACCFTHNRRLAPESAWPVSAAPRSSLLALPAPAPARTHASPTAPLSLRRECKAQVNEGVQSAQSTRSSPSRALRSSSSGEARRLLK